MSLPGFNISILEKPTTKQKQRISSFLEKIGLEYEETVEVSIIITDETTNEIVGTGSFEGMVIKCMGVSPAHRGLGFSAHLLSLLVKEEFRRGREHLFIFTSPKNLDESSGNVFSGFKLIAQTDEIALLEMGPQTIQDYLEQLKGELNQKITTLSIKPVQIGAIVVNCNPFTLGHQYLIETAAKECDLLIVFVVTENRSVFPTDVRLQLVKEGTKHIENVLVLEGGDYIISQATFPRYFMKESGNISLAQARLDVTIFAEYIVPALKITRRYVGEEPFCPVTRAYNQAMQEILVPKGIELKIIPRKELDGEAISASKVRKLLVEGKFDAIAKIVPKTTLAFLRSPAAKPIIKKIKEKSA
ncbi:MAG: [citrate (pro-3S)-lyase] ligase [Candidatus Heimdallarchaeota archaeon]|nr:[citrate (pro-3S)-lyase] ligase [Candidatus Heimdallarchaeota archaeon]